MATMHLKTEIADLTYIHITKTGGTSITQWLDETPNITFYKKWKHHASIELLNLIKHETKFTFTVVRNPWDRMVSGYHYLTQRKGLDLPKSHTYFWESVERVIGHTDMTFEDWIHNLHHLKMDPGDWATAATPQFHYIKPYIDFTIKFETMDADFIVIQDMLQDYRPLHKINSSERKEYRQYYTDETKKLVEKTFQEDIDTWGYTF